MNCDFCGEPIPDEHYAVISLPDKTEKARIHWKCVPPETPDNMCNFIIWFDECSAG